MTDVFEMLSGDHRHVKDVLEQLSDSSEGPTRVELTRTLGKALTLHMAFEEEQLYPLLVDLDEEMAEEAEIEHGLAREALQRVMELTDAPGFGAAVEMLTGALSHHVSEEEQEVFPKLRRSTNDDDLDQLASALLETKTAAGLPPFDPRTATKDQLLAVAKGVGVEGRSQMTKQQLLDALSA